MKSFSRKNIRFDYIYRFHHNDGSHADFADKMLKNNTLIFNCKRGYETHFNSFFHLGGVKKSRRTNHFFAIGKLIVNIHAKFEQINYTGSRFAN